MSLGFPQEALPHINSKCADNKVLSLKDLLRSLTNNLEAVPSSGTITPTVKGKILFQFIN